MTISPETIAKLNSFFNDGLKDAVIVNIHGYKPSTVKKYRAIWRSGK